jgi:hypothetical protein
MAANYFEWAVVFPELSALVNNIAVLIEEAETVKSWIPW